MGNDAVLGPGGAHGFDGGQHISHGAGDLAGGLATRRAVAAQGTAELSRDEDDQEEGHEDGQGDAGIDGAENDQGEDCDQPLADDLVSPIETIFRHIDVVTKAADGLANRRWQRQSARAIDSAQKEIAAQQGADEEAEHDLLRTPRSATAQPDQEPAPPVAR